MSKSIKKTKTKPKKISNKSKKKLKDTNIQIVDTDSDALVNESEKDVAITEPSVVKAVTTAEGEEFDDDEVDSEVEDEDKLDEDVEIEEEEEEKEEAEASEVSEVADIESGEDVEYKEKCLYKYANDKSEEDYDEIEDEFFSDDVEKEVIPNRVPDNERITKPIMTKYEMVRLLGIRTKQIALGAKPMIKNSDNLSSKDIARLELKHNLIPLTIVRPLPNGRKEYWKVKELSH